jgi:hypothetical protein
MRIGERREPVWMSNSASEGLRREVRVVSERSFHAEASWKKSGRSRVMGTIEATAVIGLFLLLRE